MDTEIILPYGEFDLEQLTILEWSPSDISIISTYVETTRYLQEIHQLFNVFQYNLRVLLSTYELNNSDSIKRNKPAFEDFDDRIEINALTISLISAGKTLVDALESCVGVICSESSSAKDFSLFLSGIYDSSFSYRLLTRLRDFSQHGHIPVSITQEKFRFDIAQILATPHFRHNAALKGEMRTFSEELLLKVQSEANYVYTTAIAEFAVSIFKIYSKFYLYIEEAFNETVLDFRKILSDNPMALYHKDTRYNDCLFYLVDDILHVINTSQNSKEMFDNFKDMAEQTYNKEQKELDDFKSSMQFLSI